MKAKPMTAHDIATFRESLGWSQIELAKQLGVTSAAVCQWESGKRSPSKTVLILMEHIRARASEGAKKSLVGA